MDYKKMFWEWTKKNTYLYLARGHHKQNIDDALDVVMKSIYEDVWKYCINHGIDGAHRNELRHIMGVDSELEKT